MCVFFCFILCFYTYKRSFSKDKWFLKIQSPITPYNRVIVQSTKNPPFSPLLPTYQSYYFMCSHLGRHCVSFRGGLCQLPLYFNLGESTPPLLFVFAFFMGAFLRKCGVKKWKKSFSKKIIMKYVQLQIVKNLVVFIVFIIQRVATVRTDSVHVLSLGSAEHFFYCST